MSLTRGAGLLMKRMMLTPRVRKLSWEQLRNGALTAATRFDELVSAVPQEAAGIEAAGVGSLTELVANLSASNRAIAAKIEALRDGLAPPIEAVGVKAGAGAWTRAEARADHARSLRRLAEATVRAVTSSQTAEHEMFGPLTAAEWVALVAYNHEYEARQAQRIMSSPEYRKAQGAQW